MMSIPAVSGTGVIEVPKSPSGSATSEHSNQDSSASSNPSNNQNGTNGSFQPKPLRAMLARGAACDLCRSRKVKCDGAHPVCSQCKKSARGDMSIINCVYEGGAAARAASSGATRKRAPTTTSQTSSSSNTNSLNHSNGHSHSHSHSNSTSSTAPPVAPSPYQLPPSAYQLPAKLNLPPLAKVVPTEHVPLAHLGYAAETAVREAEEVDELEPYEAYDTYKRDREPSEDVDDLSLPPPPPTKRKSISQPSGVNREQQLQSRIDELERQMHAQQPAPVHTHVRVAPSPPFYGGLPFAGASATDSTRRSRSSFGGLDERGPDIAAAWTPESNIRQTLGPEPPQPAPAGFAPGGFGVGIGEPPAASYQQPQPYDIYANYPKQQPTKVHYPVAPMSAYPSLGLTVPGPGGTGAVGVSPSSFDEPARYGAVPAPSSSSTSFLDQNGLGTTSNSSLADSPKENFVLDPTFMQLFYPGWPKGLPAKDVVVRLVNTFFVRATFPATMLSRSRLLEALDRPPLDPAFPKAALLHAICAFAAIYVQPESLVSATGGTYWSEAKSPRHYHLNLARKAIDTALASTSSGLLQILQATILCAWIAYHSADFQGVWLLSGTASRLCILLGLNHIDAWNYAQDEPLSVHIDFMAESKNTATRLTDALLPPPIDQDEHFERTATFWAAFALDRHASALTDWSTAIDERDISTHLPCRTYGPYLGLGLDPNGVERRIPALSVRNSDFLFDTSAPIGSYGLYVKATILLGRVVNYLQRMPRWQQLPGDVTCSQLKEQVKASDEFKALDYALAKFRTTTSADFIGAGDQIDSALASAYCIPHAATILLHEPFCDIHDRDPNSSLARCLTSAKCVINATYVLGQSANDLQGTDPFLSWCWTVVGRSLVRDMAIRSVWGEDDRAAVARGLAEECLDFCRKIDVRGYKIAGVLVGVMEGLLRCPQQLVPADGPIGDLG